jgi:AAA family ATP:ADP antiporter
MTSLLLVMNIFLILMAYYFIKPVREGWLSVSLFQGFTKLEVKAYSAFGQSMLLLVVVPIYAAVSARWTRRELLRRTGLLFGGALILFWLVQPGLLMAQVPFAGISFYLFVGIFSVTMVAQFWSFAADVYGQDRGRRLFPLVAVGASAGAATGSWIGERLLGLEWLDAFDLLLLALLPLGAAVALALWTDRRGSYGEPSTFTRERWDEPAAPVNEGAFQLIMRHRYLAGTALMMVLLSWVVASGDNILFGVVQATLEEQFEAAAGDPAEYARLLKNATTAFYGDLYFWINLLGLLLQALVVSRMLRYGGLGLLLLATPVISLGAYLSMAIAPVLGIIKVMKVLENSSNYSVNNTARHLLWLPTTKEMLYQAKTAIDTLFVRLGDGLAALTVLVGTRVWSLGILQFIVVNIVLIVLWIGVAFFLMEENRRWTQRQQEA